MRATLHSLWQKISQPLEILGIIIVCILIIVLFVVIALAYLFNVNIPGLRGKTIWDWLQLLIIPAVLAIGGYLLNFTTSRNERQAAVKRDQTERDIASDNQRETTLQSYIDKISELLLDRQLRESQPKEEVRTIARVRTLTTLPRLDEIRKRSAIQFLYESQLIERDKSFINLEGADLSGADLRKARLSGANLSGADLRKARLSRANLSGADLRRADLSGANLSGVDLSGADLSGADLSGAWLSGWNPHRADLSGADLSGYDFTGTGLFAADHIGANPSGTNPGAYLGEWDYYKTNLSGANLSGAYLNHANLYTTDLSGADLSGADLQWATDVTVEELEKQATILKGTTMPNGSKHP